MWSHVSVWGCFDFNTKQGGLEAVADSVALQMLGNVPLTVLLKGFYTWMWEGLGTSEACMPEDPLQWLSQPQLRLPPARLSKCGFLTVKWLSMNRGSDSDKWTRPSNVNSQPQKLQSEITLFVQPKLEVNSNSNFSPWWIRTSLSCTLKMNLQKGIKEQQCGFLVYNRLFAFGSFESDWASQR